MVLLRALAFRPADAVGAPSGQEGAGQPQARAVGRPAPGDSHEPAAAPPTQTSGGDAAQQSSSTAEGPSRAGGDEARPRAPVESGRTQHEQPRAIASATAGERPGAGGVSEVPRYDGPLASAADWHRLVASLPLAGLARQLASHSALASWDGKTLSLILAGPLDNLRSSGAEQRLAAALSAALGRDLVLTFRADANGAAAGEGRGADGAVHEPDGSRPGAPISTNPGAPPARLPGDGIDGQDMRETPASRDARDAAERVAEAESIMEADPVAGELKRRFDADWIPGSIRPAE
jgi:DNA polymerase-3 subunit gamma/tau